MGNVAGRPLLVRVRGQDIWIAWGDGTSAAANDDPLDPGRSLAAVCGGWDGEGREAPARVVALWPGRLWKPVPLPGLPPSALQVLADDPPLVWWGWSGPEGEHDLVRWSGLRERVRGFLEALPSPPGPNS